MKHVIAIVGNLMHRVARLSAINMSKSGVFVCFSWFGILLSSIICHFMHEYISNCLFPNVLLLNLQNDFKVSHNGNTSSVWCHSSDSVQRCHFKNLCYAAKEKQFIFFLTDDSIISGVNMKDIKSLPLSSVYNHNLLSMNLAVVTDVDLILNRFRVNHGAIFLLWRFKWDNIMHVLHDDLLPLYFTYASICAGNVEDCIQTYRLGFVDGGEAGELAEWYNVFSSREPLFLHKEPSDSLICFDEAHTGMLRSSIWFQYGFGRPQGPLRNEQIHGSLLHQFTHYILTKFQVQKTSTVVSQKDILLFSRRLNRRILNENFLKTMMVDSFIPRRSKLRIVSLDVAANDTKSILSAVHNSDIMVGMHGSAMIFSLFLAPGSVVVELFPFGISPQYVSPVKAWAEIEGSGIIYKSWVNGEENNSYPHPDAPPLLGGINHLPESEQTAIKKTKHVPAVECCHNALYLYRMFQDTIIGLDFGTVFEQALSEQHKFSVEKFREEYSRRRMFHYFPSAVSNIICRVEAKYMIISWQPPINLNTNPALYKVSVLSKSSFQFSLETTVPNVTVPLPSNFLEEVGVDIWIKSIVREEESIDAYIRCHMKVS